MNFRRTRCPHCRAKLESGQRIHPACIPGYADAQEAKAERAQAKQANAAAKVERAETRRRKEAIKSRAVWMAEAQAIANKYARVRDRDDGCISCDKPANWHGQWHGSHFRSVGASSATRLNLWNIHKACSICNNHLSGNIAEYTPRLIVKVGQDRVDWLKSQNQRVLHDIEYLQKYKRVIGKRLKRMESAAA